MSYGVVFQIMILSRSRPGFLAWCWWFACICCKHTSICTWFDFKSVCLYSGCTL